MEKEFIHVKVKDALNDSMIESYDYIVCPKCHNKEYYSYNTNFYNNEYTCKVCKYKNKVGKIV